jgi:branched-chain amino acid aminotransferase
MTLRLTVQRQAWLDHVRSTTDAAGQMVPVVKVDGRVIGNGKPGPMTAQLLAAFRGVTRHDGELIFKE